jgi:sugar/nucleoside kinase (ribokinase family)
LETTPLLRFVIAGQLNRDYILLPNGKEFIDVPGGSLLYAAAGLGLWEKSTGLVGRVGEDFPQEWIERITKYGFDSRGIKVFPRAIDLRNFTAYPDFDSPQKDNPVAHFSRLGLPFPKSLLGYINPLPQSDSRSRPTEITIRPNDIPADYLDATAAHLCPIDFLSHSLLSSSLRHGHVSTITIDPAEGYMDPIFWESMRSLLSGVTAFLTSEQKIRRLFHGRTTDLWEMAEAISNFGCEIVVIKLGNRGQYLLDNTNQLKWVVPAYPIQVFDPTGAGDAFCGGFLAGYRQNYDPLEATMYGNISSSFAISGSSPFFALDALPGLAQARLESLRSMVRKI